MVSENNDQLVYCISGYKNTGKTTVMTALIRILTEKGYKVAAIKHDGHDFEGDVPGTDSFRHMESGAYGTAVFSGERYLVHKKCTDTKVSEMISMFPEADIILIEGLKGSDHPKYICQNPADSVKDIPDIINRIEKLINT